MIFFLVLACAHNPTGIDPTKEQWKQIADVIEVCILIFGSFIFNLNNVQLFYYNNRSVDCLRFSTRPIKGSLPVTWIMTLGPFAILTHEVLKWCALSHLPKTLDSTVNRNIRKTILSKHFF